MFVRDLWFLALQLISVLSIVESWDLKLVADDRAWKVDGRVQAIVGPPKPGYATDEESSVTWT